MARPEVEATKENMLRTKTKKDDISLSAMTFSVPAERQKKPCSGTVDSGLLVVFVIHYRHRHRCHHHHQQICHLHLLFVRTGNDKTRKDKNRFLKTRAEWQWLNRQ